MNFLRFFSFTFFINFWVLHRWPRTGIALILMNATIAFALYTESNAIQNLNQSHVEKSRIPKKHKYYLIPGLLRSEHPHWYLLLTCAKFQLLVTIPQRDVEYLIFTVHVRTYEHNPGRTCSFEHSRPLSKRRLNRVSFYTHAVWMSHSHIPWLCVTRNVQRRRT